MLRSVLTGAAALLIAACSGSGNYRDTSVPISTVERVDLERYAGLWYEIARFPNSFERNCVGVTAEYLPRADGSVTVINTCRKNALDGEVERAEGIATVKDGSNGAWLKVKFVQWLPFAGDYLILGLAEDYSLAVVGDPKGNTGWILARDPMIDAETLQTARDVLARNGYDLSQLQMTPQPPA
ncbi:lipocalin family protein [Oceanomicrobium pacificus]|uniref:Outer membrane lipoprotein Blc n=1 Tax=Oceanomicrobium pacificus TaxID=2692916 RepID=A0A6B0THP2_9RHOB|nr:lipocalin family protein [Oceanomicrobium pacificus]MXU63900.1 lipocalin [Oceanomicrobium pacificus]